jgi:AcrR family transcriptional regulator
VPQSDSPRIHARETDLSTYARIRHAALEAFATRGTAATSIRDVAAAAGVSPGLVQHHFGTKAGLKDAVDQYVIDVAISAFVDLVGERPDGEAWTRMGDTVTTWVAENMPALRYVARALADADPGAERIFAALLDIARTQWLAPLRASGAIDPDLDAEWAALHVIVFNLATVLLEPAISRQLPEPFLRPTQLQRWNAATTELYRRGLASRGRPRRRPTAG